MIRTVAAARYDAGVDRPGLARPVGSREQRADVIGVQGGVEGVSVVHDAGKQLPRCTRTSRRSAGLRQSRRLKMASAESPVAGCRQHSSKPRQTD
jgi:hypothetical protein